MLWRWSNNWVTSDFYANCLCIQWVHKTRQLGFSVCVKLRELGQNLDSRLESSKAPFKRLQHLKRIKACICARGAFLGANSRAPTSSHSPWESIYLSLVPCTWFSPGRGPLMGRICPRGLPAVAWVLHESGYPLLVLELWPGSHLSLLFSTVLRYWGLSWCRPFHGLSYPWVSGGGTVDALTWRRLTLVTPHLGDASSWRRLILATPYLSNAYTWWRLKQSTCWLPSLGPLEGSHHMLTLTLGNARGRDGTVYIKVVLRS